MDIELKGFEKHPIKIDLELHVHLYQLDAMSRVVRDVLDLEKKSKSQDRKENDNDS